MQPGKPRIQPDNFAYLDDDKEYLLVTVDLRRVKKEDIDLRMRDDLIYVRAERGDIEFSGHIHSAEKIDWKKAKASFKNGLLDKVSLREKRPSAMRIEIE